MIDFFSFLFFIQFRTCCYYTYNQIMENILKKIESQINLTTLKLQVPGLKKYNLQILYSHKFYMFILLVPVLKFLCFHFLFADF